ncbi:MAG: prepilin-type N-terminal cleavage/methylation domain-containing protein [Fimbriimonas sp.]
MKHAFTLIELLVVIAIIAILAAILFPVFAQAKTAAKKTSALSNIKQTNLGAVMYQSDYDDTYPLQQGRTDEVGWLWDYYVRIPADWVAARPASFSAAQETAWANSIQPYLKSRGLLHVAGEEVTDYTVDSYASPRQTPDWAIFQYNGLLTQYNGTAVAAPSSLITFWQGRGVKGLRGYGGVNPVLVCEDANAACRLWLPNRTALRRGMASGRCGESHPAPFGPMGEA